MHLFKRLACGLLAAVTIATPALAADGSDLEASLTWRLNFGSHVDQPGLGLALGMRSDDLAAPRTRLLAFETDAGGSVATLAGLPLFARAYRANQSEDAPAAAPETADKPWYAHSWVLWTAGGLAATAALASSGGGSVSYNENGNSGNGNTVRNGTGGAGCSGGGNVGPEELPNACVVCNDGSVASECGQGFTDRPPAMALSNPDADRQRWPDAGTGGMGDLVAR